MNRESLLQLFERHQGKVSDKWQLYLEEYERLLAPYRDRPVRLLEIGVQNGGTLEIWAKYFPQAKVLIGCDIDPACAELEFDDPRISVIIGDVNNDKTQAQISAASIEFDIIVDDGSHRSGDTIRSFGLLLPKLALGGSYVIEDLHCSYWDVYEGGLYYPFSSIAFLKSLADTLNHNHWGLEKSIDAILEGFKTVHQVAIDRESLRLIHSVEFTDSICTIRKLHRSKNVLGKRMVSGKYASVVPVEELGSQMVEDSIVPSQQGNHWSNGNYPSSDGLFLKIHAIHEQKQWIAKLIEDIDERDDRIGKLLEIIKRRDDEHDLLKQSLSWRLTTLLRKLRLAPESAETSYGDNDAGFPDKAGVPSSPPDQPDAANLVPDELRYSTRSEDEFIRSTRPVIELLKTSEPSGAKWRDIRKPSKTDRNDYAEWVMRYDTLWDTDRIRIRHAIDDMVHQPLLSVLILTHNSNIEWLTQAVDSIRNQLYDNWELCIAADVSTCEPVRKYLAALPKRNARIKIILNQMNLQYSAATNNALQNCRGNWVVLMHQDDILPEHALFHIINAINRHPDTCLIYTDEDKIDENGARSEPYFKCDWNRDLFYSQDFISCPGVYRREILDKIGGFRTGFEGAQNYDLALRCIEQIDYRTIRHIPMVLCHRRRHSGSAAPGANVKSHAIAASQKALQDHLDRIGISATVEPSSNGCRVRYALPVASPMVSLIIPTRNGWDLLKTCINSIETRTNYPNYEILVVDNGSDDPTTIDYIASLKGNARIRVLHDARPFNYAELNNYAVEEARGELIGLINNDTEVIEEQWLTEMVSIALQPGVGFVGSKLLYPDGTIQHAGVILGIRGVAAHAFKHAPGDSPGYFNRIKQISSFSALTGACLVIKKSVFLEAGGLDSNNLAIAFNDIDLCLRVRELGYRNVFTPYALLYHHESASRGLEDTPEKKARFAKEVDFMKKRWGDKLLNDPAYSPNLSLDDQDFSLAWPPRINGQYLP